ncbi:MAG: hypothetical protein J5825_05235 [Lachnospiraceae bacterium]|nr:hypothetical protein [Lachnospiraceae bacterium]
MKKQQIALTLTFALLLGFGGCQANPQKPAESASQEEVSTEVPTQDSSVTESETPEAEAETAPLKITKQPKSTSAASGTEVTFSVEATGSESLKYYWQYQKPGSSTWTPSSDEGANTPVFTLTMNDDLDQYRYRCMVREKNGDQIYSVPVRLESTSLLPIDETTFPDEGFRRRILKSYDIDLDRNLSPYELSCTVSMNLSSPSICDLTGIEYFKNLKELYIWRTGLTGFDGSVLPKLMKLDCRDNKLTELDLGENTALIELNCSGNPLESLDVSSLSGLRILNCSNIGIDSLDLSANSALKELYCSENRLRSLDVSGLSDLQLLYCSNNGLDSLDLSHNPKLTYLDCSFNQLSALDTDLCPALFSIRCQENPMSELNVQNCKKLMQIYAGEDVLVTGQNKHTDLTVHRPLTPDEYDEASGFLNLKDGIYRFEPGASASTLFIEDGTLNLKGAFSLWYSYPDENDVYTNTIVLLGNSESARIRIHEDAVFSESSGTFHEDHTSTDRVNRTFKYYHERMLIGFSIRDGVITSISIHG